MEMEAIVNLIKDTGVTIGILVYFCWVNCKYMQRIDETMTLIRDFITNDK